MKINTDIPAPYAIQIEPVEGCSLACSFCGIQSIRDNGADAELNIHGKNSAPYKFMSEETLILVVSQAVSLGWNPRWEFAMHGEPTMHPDLPKLIKAVRSRHKKGYIMVTSNGSGLLKNCPQKVKALFDAGVNTLALDDYDHSGGWVERIITELDEYQSVNGVEPWKTFRYPEQTEGNPHQRHNGKKLVIIKDISTNTSGTHQLTNQGGNSFKSEHLAERCAKPFRELSFRFDGNVALCCDDWPGQYKIANIHTTSLEDIWYHPRFEAARRLLYGADRAFGPCAGCNVRTARNGLLPDKLGKGTMLPPDAESAKFVRQALGGKVFSIKEVKA